MTEATRREKPVIVTLLGGGILVLAAPAFLGAALMLLDVWSKGDLTANLSPGTRKMLISFPPSLNFSGPSWILFALAWCALCLLLVIAAIQFLRLRAWARAALETVTWLALLALIAWAACAVVGFARSGVFEMSLALFGLVPAHVGVPALLVWALRTREVRDAMLPRRTPLSAPPEVPHA